MTVALGDPQEDHVVELRAFDIIDSHDTDTATPAHPPLACSSYRNDGLYEIYWEVNSLV